MLYIMQLKGSYEVHFENGNILTIKQSWVEYAHDYQNIYSI